jgi:hypothetical protein
MIVRSMLVTDAPISVILGIGSKEQHSDDAAFQMITTLASRLNRPQSGLSDLFPIPVVIGL